MKRASLWAGANPALMALLLCALLLRILVPAGYMAGTAAGGAPALILCPDAGPPPGAMHHHQHDGRDPAGHGACPFAALAAPALPPAPPAILAAAPATAPAAAPALAAAPIRPRLAAPPPPATGPPATV